MTAEIEIRPLREGEESLWAAMRLQLWPDCGAEENAEDVASLADPRGALRVVFLAFSDGRAVGFAEISERSIVAGAGQQPAAYLEGWYVEQGFRRQGVGSAMVGAAVDWARQQGYGFLGSDTDLDNRVSQHAHEKLGFQESDRAVHYVLALTP